MNKVAQYTGVDYKQHVKNIIKIIKPIARNVRILHSKLFKSYNEARESLLETDEKEEYVDKVHGAIDMLTQIHRALNSVHDSIDKSIKPNPGKILSFVSQLKEEFEKEVTNNLRNIGKNTFEKNVNKISEMIDDLKDVATHYNEEFEAQNYLMKNLYKPYLTMANLVMELDKDLHEIAKKNPGTHIEKEAEKYIKQVSKLYVKVYDFADVLKKSPVEDLPEKSWFLQNVYNDFVDMYKSIGASEHLVHDYKDTLKYEIKEIVDQIKTYFNKLKELDK